MPTKEELQNKVSELEAELDQRSAQEEAILDALGVEIVEDEDDADDTDEDDGEDPDQD